MQLSRTPEVCIRWYVIDGYTVALQSLHPIVIAFAIPIGMIIAIFIASPQVIAIDTAIASPIAIAIDTAIANPVAVASIAIDNAPPLPSL